MSVKLIDDNNKLDFRLKSSVPTGLSEFSKDDSENHNRRNNTQVENKNFKNYDSNNNERKTKNDDILPPINIKKFIEVKIDKKKSIKINSKKDENSPNKILQNISHGKTPNLISYTVRKSSKTTIT